jgi:hypothetical protein
MALIEAEIASFLIGNAQVTALVGTHIYPNKAPVEEAYPCVTYFRVSGFRIRDMSGASGLTHARIQINSWSFDYAVAKAIADRIRRELDNFRGTMGATAIDAIFLMEEADLVDKKLAVDSTVPYGIRQDYQIRHREQVDDNTA